MRPVTFSRRGADYPTGCIKGLLSLITFLAFSTVSVACGAAVTADFFGLHIHRADRGTAWPAVTFGSWRLWDAHVTWADLEPKQNEWDFSRLDRYVAMAALTRVDLLLPLAKTPAWASARPSEVSAYQRGNASEPKDLDLWRDYVQKIGERYKGKIRHYEIWNEPSDKNFFTGSVDSLVILTCEARRILKAIDPDVRIVSPASAGGGRNVDYLDKFLSSGGSECIDIVAHHFYVYQYGPEAMIPMIKSVRSVMKKNGVESLPLWNTEAGWWLGSGDGSPEHAMVTNTPWKKYVGDAAATLPFRTFLIALSEGVDRFYWYAWDNRNGLGMLEASSQSEKTSVEGWRFAVSKLLGAKQVKCRPNNTRWHCTVLNSDSTTSDYQWAE